MGLQYDLLVGLSHPTVLSTGAVLKPTHGARVLQFLPLTRAARRLESSKMVALGDRKASMYSGADPGGGGNPGGQDPSPPPFWGTPKLKKEKQNTLRACARMRHVLVVNS